MDCSSGSNLVSHVVVLGAGHGGGAVVAALRQMGHAGRITLVGEEPVAPYQRPPLSKAWLKGGADLDALLLRPAEWYREQDIDLRLGVRAVDVDRAAKRVALDDGESLAYDILIFATGARARLLTCAGAELAGVTPLRTVEDASRLKDLLGPGRRLGIVGGGYVGLEAAASAVALGASAIVVEREDRILARVASPGLSQFFHLRHRAHGVDFQFASEVVRIEAAAGRRRLLLTRGGPVTCDAILVGVGAIPNDELARAAGLACDAGILVDDDARTSEPDVFALGDVTRRPVRQYERIARIESVPNALEQAKQAAAAICGRPRVASETPWFWSDQYDLKLQIAGLMVDADQHVVRGDPMSNSFAIYHLRGDVVRAVEAVNAPADFMGGRQLISKGVRVDPARLADPGISIRQVAAA